MSKDKTAEKDEIKNDVVYKKAVSVIWLSKKGRDLQTSNLKTWEKCVGKNKGKRHDRVFIYSVKYSRY